MASLVMILEAESLTDLSEEEKTVASSWCLCRVSRFTLVPVDSQFTLMRSL